MRPRVRFAALWLAGALSVSATPGAPAPGPEAMFQARRVVRTGVVPVRAPLDSALHCFTPEGERAWAAGWDPQFIYPPTGAPERDLIFATEHSPGKGAVWIMLEYDAARHAVEYIYVVPETVVCRIRVACEANGAGTTRARVTYLMTGLSPAGNERVEHLSEEAFAARMADWERRIEDSLDRKPAGD